MSGPFVRARAVLLTPSLTDVSAFLREALLVVYKKFQSMAPDLSFLPSRKELRCCGCFTLDFDSCAFEMQMWSVQISSDVTQYICQLRRTSYGGREPFSELLRVLASNLKLKGYATEYADGRKILEKLSIDDDHLNMCFMNTACDGSPNASHPVCLERDDVTLLSSHVAERTYPFSSDTLRLLAQCSAGSRENCEMLLESEELGKELVRWLNDESEVSSCLNALKLIELGASAPKDAFKAIAGSMVVHCGVKPSSGKGIRSQAIENAALGAMNKLMKRLKNNEREETFQVIEKVLSGKIKEKLFQKVKVMMFTGTQTISQNFC